MNDKRHIAQGCADKELNQRLRLTERREKLKLTVEVGCKQFWFYQTDKKNEITRGYFDYFSLFQDLIELLVDYGAEIALPSTI